MARLLGIDFGQKRTGIAVTDEMQIIASPLDTVETSKLLDFLDIYFKTEQVECVVIGQPKRFNGEFSDNEENILKFIGKFKGKFPKMKVQRVDERFTSKLAFQAMIDSGMKKKKRQDKGTIDKISASLILENYMNSKF